MNISPRFEAEGMQFHNCTVQAHYRRINGVEYRFSTSTVWDDGRALAVSYLVTKWVPVEGNERQAQVDIVHSLTKDYATGRVFTSADHKQNDD